MENYSRFTDPKLPAIYEKVQAEQRLSFEEGFRFMKVQTLLALDLLQTMYVNA